MVNSSGIWDWFFGVRKDQPYLLSPIIVVIVIVTAMALYFGIGYLQTVAKVYPVGRMIGIHFHSDTRSEVETDAGKFFVNSGPFPLLKGSALEIEERKNGVRYLCNRDLNICEPLK